MHRILRRSIPPSVRAIESASRRPTLCFVVRDDENKTGGMIVREKNLPAEVGKTQTPPRSANEVIAEMAAKVAHYPAKPKEEWEGMSAEEMYQRGQECDKNMNYKEAVKWYHSAAEQGYAEAQFYVGEIYCHTALYTANRDFEFLRTTIQVLPVEQEFNECEEELYKWYSYAVPPSYKEAAKWYRRAAEQGHADAHHQIGEMYTHGWGFPKNDVEAAKWYHRAAERGQITAHHMLAEMYAYGRGVPKDNAEVAKWYRRAAEQGDNSAQYNLGMKYAKGEGVPQDYVKAIKWLRRAAEQGYDLAQDALHQLEQKK